MLACGLKHINAIAYDCEIAQIGAGATQQGHSGTGASVC